MNGLTLNAIDLGRRVTGRASLSADMLRSRRANVVEGAEFDSTGLMGTEPDVELPRLIDRPDLLFVLWPSLAHSYWRAQELTLFRRHAELLRGPIVDFGCGDGSFAAALGVPIEVGLDNDPAATAIAQETGAYSQLLNTGSGAIPLADGFAETVIANSVLEHVRELDAMLAEIRRILSPTGRLVFTAPTPVYTQQLTRYFGAKAAADVNAESSHLNLLSPEEWTERLAHAGLTTSVVVPHQPARFTYRQRMLRLMGDQGLGRVIPNAGHRFARRYATALGADVTTSIGGIHEAGANVFIVAEVQGAN
jgi:SAM-dependent methyltransferase